MRKTYLDAIKILACFLVIVNHTNSRIFLACAPSETWFVSLIYFFVSKTAVPLFLMVSGASLLSKCDSYKKTVGRFLRILAALIVFSIPYYIKASVVSGTDMSFVGFFEAIYRNNITNAFWYLYLYLGIIAMLPLLQKMFGVLKERDYIYFCTISLVLIGSVPLIKHYIPFLSESVSIYMPLFSAYFGLMAAGRYFDIRAERKYDVCISSLLFIVCIAACVVGTYFEYKADSSYYLFFDNRVMVLITVPSVCLFVISKSIFGRIKISERREKVLGTVSGLTFGIYLLSDFVIDMTDGLFTVLSAYMHQMAAMFIWEIIVFAICLVVVFILKRIVVIKKML